MTTPKRPRPSEEDLRDAYNKMAMDWLIRKLYSGVGGMPFAPGQVADSDLPDDVKAILQERIKELSGM